MNPGLRNVPDPAGAPVPWDDDVPWAAWTPADAAARLGPLRTPAGRPVRWAVAGGWALDLFLGRVTRPHEDLEVVVLADDVPAVLAAFTPPAWTWAVPTDTHLHPVDSAACAGTHQTWLWSRAAGAFVLDVFRDEHDGDTWRCRRDPSLTRPWPQVVGTSAGGVPYLAPEVVLLFKARHARPKDAADLAAAWPALDGAQRAWLRAALDRVHPGHPWRDTGQARS